MDTTDIILNAIYFIGAITIFTVVFRFMANDISHGRLDLVDISIMTLISGFCGFLWFLVLPACIVGFVLFWIIALFIWPILAYVVRFSLFVLLPSHIYCNIPEPLEGWYMIGDWLEDRRIARNYKKMYYG